MAILTFYRLVPRRIVRFLAVSALLLAGMALGAGALVVAHGGDTSSVHACVNNSSGSLRIVDATDECRTNERALDWSTQGQAGPPGQPGEPGEPGEPGAPGVFSGVFISDNGLYSIGVTDDGIVLNGPTGTLQLTGAGVTIIGMNVQIQGNISTRVNGTQVILNCGLAGGAPVARAGDPVEAPGGTGVITAGSPSVRAC